MILHHGSHSNIISGYGSFVGNIFFGSAGSPMIGLSGSAGGIITLSSGSGVVGVVPGSLITTSSLLLVGGFNVI